MIDNFWIRDPERLLKLTPRENFTIRTGKAGMELIQKAFQDQWVKEEKTEEVSNFTHLFKEPEKLF